MIVYKKKIWVSLIGTLLLLVALLFLNSRVKPQMDAAIIKESAFINYPAEYNYRQSVNDCGPFNVAAVIRALIGKNVDSAALAHKIGWRLANGYTLPWGLESQIRSHGINIAKPHVGVLSDDEKITLVRGYLSMGRPIVILGERDNYEHYVTILGFASDMDQYFIYDSIQAPSHENPELTTDDNDFLPGNKIMKSRELLDFWRGGGMYGFWEWYGLVAGL